MIEFSEEKKKQLEELQKPQFPNRNPEQDAKNRQELRQIIGRMTQQFVSEKTGFKGVPDAEEQKMIEDRANMILRQRRKSEAEAAKG